MKITITIIKVGRDTQNKATCRVSLLSDTYSPVSEKERYRSLTWCGMAGAHDAGTQTYDEGFHFFG